MVPWVFFPKKLICGRPSHSEEKDEADSTGLHYSESTAEVASGGTRLSVTSKTLPSVALLQTDAVSDWGSLVLADVPLSKPHGWGVGQADKLTWHSLVNPASSWPCQVKSALFPTKCGGCRAAHHLHLLERPGKGCRGSGQQSSLRTAHWDVLCWGGFSSPRRGSD